MHTFKAMGAARGKGVATCKGATLGKGTAGERTARNKLQGRRWRVTSAETSFLEAVFLRTRKPSRTTTEHLAHNLAVRPRQVQVWYQNRRQRLRNQSPTSPGSPVGDITDCDTVHPDSINSLMRQFLDLPDGRAASDDEDEDDKEHADEHMAASDGSDGSLHSLHNSADEADVANYKPESVWQTMCGSRGSSAQHSVPETEESEAAYLRKLASLIDIRPGLVSLGDLLCHSLGGAEEGGGATGGSGELGVFQKLHFSAVDEAAQASLGVEWLLYWF